MRLYHYTCSGAARLIDECGYLLPYPQTQLDGRKLIWLTDMDTPDRQALGLTSHTLSRDRTKHRVTVDVNAHRWVHYVRTMPTPARRLALDLAMAPGARPMHWWVAANPVPAGVLERVQ